MKRSFKVRISRKLIVIAGGVLVLCGGTGAAAVFIGTEALLGPSYLTLNGLSCTEVKTVKITKDKGFWIRKYVTTETTDGLSRVKTALRVASAVYAADKPDLVQVVVLDQKGPENRSDMRGRAIGADVIYIADTTKVHEDRAAVTYTARYVDKPATAGGLFYGEKIDMPLADIQGLVARLDDKTDCRKLEIAAPEGHTTPSGHGERTPTHGEAPADGHGAAAPAAHGEEATGHDVPVAEGEHGVPAEHGTEAPASGGGWLASLKGMVGLGGGVASVPAEDHGTPVHDTAPAEDSAALPAEAGHVAEPEAHGAPVEHGVAPAPESDAAHAAADPHGATAPTADVTAHAAEATDHGADAAVKPADEAAHVPTTEHEAASAHAAPAAAVTEAATAPAAHAEKANAAAEAAHADKVTPVEKAAAADEAGTAHKADAAKPTAEPPTADQGWLSSLKSMVLGDGEEAASVEEHSSAEPAPAASPAVATDGAAAPAANTADDYGKAFLAKLRAKKVDAATAPAKETPAPADASTSHAAPAEVQKVSQAAPPAEDSDVLPPKAHKP